MNKELAVEVSGLVKVYHDGDHPVPVLSDVTFSVARGETVAIAVTAAFVALLTTPVLPAGLPVLAAAGVAVVAGLLPARRRRSASRASG